MNQERRHSQDNHHQSYPMQDIHTPHANEPEQPHSKPPSVSLIKAPKERSKYLPCFSCIRSTCGRVTCCVCLVLLLVIIILVIIIFTVFKIPVVDYMGTVGDPVFTFNKGNTTFGVDMVASIQVQNPNPIGFNFELLDIKARFPGYEPTLGGGNLTNTDFPSKSTTNATFPISIAYDRNQDKGFTIIRNILSKCGILGGSDGEIEILYDLKATVKIIGITIRPDIKNQSYSVKCPVNIAEIAKGIPGGISSFLGNLIG
ncbi:hypothetical protein BGZ96_008287 [Linnemannia gamsii]|uniref:Late embryogenesis abundant protein LEA-2 subgroup domain-containing protein n=1 Tax=Linnemannia gamsii TaxID=64522 RepID=A0ABQ7JYJ8_9FUNG|nr:hypothetical protein BGZ96_008287 [Linnemannia gamsii]